MTEIWHIGIVWVETQVSFQSFVKGSSAWQSVPVLMMWCYRRGD
jgi:hypothetical protein